MEIKSIQEGPFRDRQGGFCTLLFCIFLFAMANIAWSQDMVLAESFLLQDEAKVKSVLNKIISIRFEETPVLEALTKIADETEGIQLNYNRNKLNTEILINEDYIGLPVFDILNDISERAGIFYFMSGGGQLIITQDLRDITDQIVTVEGIVQDANTGEALPGVNIVVQGSENVAGSTIGTQTDINGAYSINVPEESNTLVFSYIGYQTLEVEIQGRTEINVELQPDIQLLDDVVVVGYGVQRRSDLTGTVSSIPQERLETVPNVNFSQAIQGAAPGVMVQTTSAGAAPSEALMIRGRNSITASNNPLIVVDGVSYEGNIFDINPNDIESIEILKDASAAAIYGSRGANGVILVTTKEGIEGNTRIRYNSHVSFQRYVNLPDVMNGTEFIEFREERFPGVVTQSETEVLNSGNSVDWMKLGLRNGISNEHNLSVSGGIGKTTYYVSGGLLGVQGIALNDDFQRVTGRINLDTSIKDWLTIGTRTQLSYEDRSGVPPNQSDLFYMNPNSTPYDEDGNLTIYPWPEDTFFQNPLAPTLYEDTQTSNQIISNSFAIVEFPFLEGLSYRFNAGIRAKSNDIGTYRGRDTKIGLENRGTADLSRGSFSNNVYENILSFNRDLGVHTVFATAVLGYEKNKSTTSSLFASGFPNDFLTYYSAQQAEASIPSFSFNETTLLSQMLRLNYGYDSRYLITITGRRDGFSGFGADTKWGFFPSVALAWNIVNEDFFPWKNTISELKPRVSFGINGNQAIGAYTSLSSLSSRDFVDRDETQAGFIPTKLGQENLGWEESRTINVGLDIGLFQDRIYGEINLFQTNTTDLILNRSISSVHGITSIIQNIGEIKNKGIEFSVRSRNTHTNNFMWTTSGNVSYVQNEIMDLYGDGNDDVANAWFISQPINVNYDFVIDGVWQSDEAEEAAEWGSQPGFIKIRDVNGDGDLNADDRQIIGQQDPKVMWGMTNTFSYQNFTLNIFIHGVRGVTRANPLKTDTNTFAQVRRNTIRKNWWTPNNPTNDFPMNHIQAEVMAGVGAPFYEDASYVRIKDISLSYDIPQSLLQRFGMNGLRLFATGRNLYTLTEWGGLDPELDAQLAIPLQREFTFGVNLQF